MCFSDQDSLFLDNMITNAEDPIKYTNIPG